MTIEKAKKANEITKEIENLEKYRRLLNGEYKNTVHMAILEHNGKVIPSQQIYINKRHNERFFVVIDRIIAELKIDLDEL